MQKEHCISMVYGVYINPEADWKMLITAQLEDIKRTGVFEASKLYVVVTNPFDTPGVREFFLGLDLDLHELSIHTENRFEYPAIKKVYDLSLSLGGNALIAYFHSKGMSYANNKRRSKQEIVLTHYTFRKWRMVVDLFSKNRELSMAGLAPAAESAFIWYNFWWARASFLRTREEPIVTEDRFYYEYWLSKSRPDWDGNIESFALMNNKPSTYSRPMVFRRTQMLLIANLRLILWKKLMARFS